VALDEDTRINHPPHYKVNGMECIDVIEALGLGYHLGNVLKYMWRAGRKLDTEMLIDLQKAKWYLDRKILQLSNERGID
jgi:hypothetical protein